MHSVVFKPYTASHCKSSHSFFDLSFRERSGRTAATSSIFLNCHGKRDGYRKGRISNPGKKLISVDLGDT